MKAEERRMDSRKLLLLVGALLVAGMTAVFARTLTAGSGAPQAGAAVIVAPPPETGPEVLVATRALPVGTIIDATALKFQPWPKEMVGGAYYLKGQADLAKLQGTVVRYAITAGQPLTQGAVVQPGDRGFLAAALTPGMRAVTVPVSAQTGVAGFVFPGDRIDMVLTQDVAGGGDGPPLKGSETILRNVRVLATDQRTDSQSGEDGHTTPLDYLPPDTLVAAFDAARLSEEAERRFQDARRRYDARSTDDADEDGRVTRAEMLNPSGVPATDEALLDVLRGLSIDTPPPPRMSMPVRAVIRGRRPA